jgi:hypothetical protein
MILADGFWSGAGGAIIAAAIGVAGGVIGFVVQWLRDRRRIREEQRRRAQDLRDASRHMAQAFDSAASALRVARESGGSLDKWSNDDETLWPHVDRIRRDAGSELWNDIEKAVQSLKILRGEHRMNRLVAEQDCDDWSRSFADLAKQLRAAY